MDSHNPNFRIALSIKGARRDTAGFGSIVNVGALAGFEDSNDIMDKPPLTSAEEENPIIILKNAEEYVSLRLVDSLVKPVDGIRGGQLSIGITLPANARIKDGKSPYSLLMEIYQRFKDDYMTPSDDNYYKFTEKEVSREVFEEIINRYPIVETTVRPAVMRGATIRQLRVPEDKIESFFRDTQYLEFMGYKEIEVTTKGKNDFPGLIIPRPKSYQVWVNGEPKDVFLQADGDEYLAHLNDAADFRYESLKVTLGTLLSAKGHTLSKDNATAELDEANERVIIKLKPVQKWYQKDIKFHMDCDEEAEQYAKRNLGKLLKILVDGVPWEEPSIKPSEAKRAINNNAVSIHPSDVNGYSFSIKSVEVVGNKFVITIGAYKKSKKSGGYAKPNKETYSGFNAKWFVIGLLSGLLVGAGVIWALCHLNSAPDVDSKGPAPTPEVSKTLGEKESASYNELMELPFDDSQDSVQRKDKVYLKRLMDNDTNAYAAYCSGYPKGNSNFNGGHFDTVSMRLERFRADRKAYFEVLSARLDKYYSFARDASNSSNKNYPSVIEWCDKYENLFDTVQKLCDEKNKMDDKLSEIQQWRSEANEKIQEAGDGTEQNEKETLLADALKELNNQNLNWVRKLSKEQKKLLGNERINAYEWILDYKSKNNDERKKIAIERVLSEKQFPEIKFKNWKQVLDIKKEIDKVVN